MSNKNRRKGHNAERHYANIFKELYPDVVTSRYGSRQMDDAKVDLFGLPFLAQIKAGKQKGLKVHEVLQEMKELVPKQYKDDLKVVIHHREGTRGKKRTEFDSIVSMTFEDFLTIIKLLHDGSIQKY